MALGESYMEEHPPKIQGDGQRVQEGMMKILRCPNCGEIVQKYHDECPRCGEPLKTNYCKISLTREEEDEVYEN